MTVNELLGMLKRVKRTKNGWEACCPAHDDKTASLSIAANNGAILVKCHAGCTFDAIAAALRLSKADFFETHKETKVERREVCVYQYTDEIGNVLYEVVRYEPKTFRQRHTVNGEKVWSMEGVRRVLYNLPNVLARSLVFVVEGEKDADTLNAMGYTATCNVGGAGKWLDGYTESLSGKEVVIIPDNDEPGKEHADLVMKSLAGKVQAVRRISVPAPHKDVTDFVRSFPNTDEAAKALETLIQAAPLLTRGIDLPVMSMDELECEYRKFIAKSKDRVVDLSRWLPSLKKYLRGVVPGELVTILADTGVGKSMALQNIAYCLPHLTVLLFEIELPGAMMYERFVSIAHAVGGIMVESTYRAGERYGMDRLKNVWVCTLSKITVADIERIIMAAELKIGAKPDVVMIDYIGLIRGGMGKRYERLSSIAEELKVIAKTTDTCVFVSSQVHRSEDGEATEPGLHDAKDSGSIENSSQLVLGLSRSDETTMKVRVLKSTKGGGGKSITCNFDGEKMRITERAEMRLIGD